MKGMKSLIRIVLLFQAFSKIKTLCFFFFFIHKPNYLKLQSIYLVSALVDHYFAAFTDANMSFGSLTKFLRQRRL